MTTLQKGKTFEAEFIRAGTVKYDDETILIREENLDKIARNFEGAPVIIGHEIVNDDNIDKLKVGVCGKYSPAGRQLGFRSIDLIIDDDQGLQAINSGMTVSCSLLPTETKEGGTYNNVPYDREVINAEGLHMALVTEPRYEEASIYNNSKSSDKKENEDNNLIKAAMFKIFNNSKKSDMNLENTNILINGKSFKASDVLENSKEGLILKTDILNNEKEEDKKEEDKKDNEMKEEDKKEEKKDNEMKEEDKKEEDKKDNEMKEEDKEDKKDNECDKYKLSNGEEKTAKELVEMVNKMTKSNEKEKNNSKLPLQEALDNSISVANEKEDYSSYFSSKKSAELGTKLF